MTKNPDTYHLEKKNWCSVNFFCLTMNVAQESQCKYFVHSCFDKHEKCTQFDLGRCNSREAKKEVTEKLVKAVKNISSEGLR